MMNLWKDFMTSKKEELVRVQKVTNKIGGKTDFTKLQISICIQYKYKELKKNTKNKI